MTAIKSCAGFASRGFAGCGGRWQVETNSLRLHAKGGTQSSERRFRFRAHATCALTTRVPAAAKAFPRDFG